MVEATDRVPSSASNHWPSRPVPSGGRNSWRFTDRGGNLRKMGFPRFSLVSFLGNSYTEPGFEGATVGVAGPCFEVPFGTGPSAKAVCWSFREVAMFSTGL